MQSHISTDLYPRLKVTVKVRSMNNCKLSYASSFITMLHEYLYVMFH